MGKLIKNEFRSTYKTFLSLFAVIIATAFLPLIGTKVAIGWVNALLSLVIMVAFIGVIVVYINLTIQRYKNSLYTEEGYLAFTLPVKGWEIILSKLLVATIWAVLTSIIAMLFNGITLFMVTAQVHEGLKLSDVLQQLNQFGYGNMAFLYAVSIIIIIEILIKVYMCISISNLGIFSKGGSVISFIAFFVISYVEARIFERLLLKSENRYSYGVMSGQNEFEMIRDVIMAPYALMAIVAIIIFFSITAYLTSKKVDLK